MSRMYSVTSEHATGGSGNALNTLEFNVPSDKVMVLHSIRVGQISLAGEAEAELGVCLISRATGSGSGGTAETPAPLDEGDPAAGVTVEGGNTTAATGTTELFREAWNLQAGFYYMPTPEERITVQGGGRLVLLTAVTSENVTTEATAVFEEVG